VFKGMPAPKNLTIPAYTLSADARVSIGVDETAKPV
jgi:Rieske Fe-S protein